jgi:hypothetical protein
VMDLHDVEVGSEIHSWNADVDQDSFRVQKCEAGLDSGSAYAVLFSDGEECVEDKKRPKNTTSPLERVRALLQKCPDGWFDRYDLKWKGKRNNGGGGKEVDTLRAIIPWDRLEGFVHGEQSMRDFPCTFNCKTYRTVEPGSRTMIRESTATLVIRYAFIM